jgi:riboflavin synthase
MFTGLIEEIGTLRNVQFQAGSRELVISGKEVLEDMKKGDSIAVSGVCLTVTRLSGQPADRFSADVSPETLQKTNLGKLRVGAQVNLERALKVGERLGGHFVTGHIDGVGVIKKKTKEGNTFLLEFEVPPEIMNYVIPKGSVAVDGISLTIAGFSERRLKVAVIPHTMHLTTLGLKRVGDEVNVEADILGKYIATAARQKGKIDLDFLEKYGYRR